MKIHQHGAFSQKPGLILLDLDNTVYEYEPCHTAGMTAAHAVAQHNLNVERQEFDRHFGEARAEIKARLGTQASSHSRILYFQRTLERAGFACEICTALQMEKAYWCAYLDIMRLFESVVEFLDDLRIAGIPVIIVTDLTAEIQYRKIILLGLDGAIDGIVTSEGSGSDKPAPASFRMAVERVTEASKGSIWMIGDNAASDLVGAKQAVGATTLQKMHDGVKPPASLEFVDATFRSFSEIRNLLQSLL